MSQNVLVVHGGGPTAVINASLYGVIEEAKRNPEVGKVYGAIGGTGAIFSETFIDLTSFDDEKLKLLLHTPASAIGSSRYPLYEKDYENSGCQVIFQAAATGEGITQIEELLRGKTTIMAGPSGVGKSSTLNCISKEKQMETGAVSEKIKR